MMCRWLAYCGDPIRMDTLLYRAEDSFAEQSLHAQHSLHVTNGDGCGLGWFGGDGEPGLFRSVRPAWNSENLKDLSRHVVSHLFLAHARATSGTAIQQSNCHPFRYANLLFQHNGAIREFGRLKRDIDLEIAPELYPLMEGSTDSQRLFFLALTYGLQDDVPTALSRMVGTIERLARHRQINDPLIMTIAVADGHRLFAVRYSSNGCSPSLYHSRNLHALREVGGSVVPFTNDTTIVLSEPLDEVSEHWREVPESTMLVVSSDGVAVRDFVPVAA